MPPISWRIRHSTSCSPTSCSPALRSFGCSIAYRHRRPSMTQGSPRRKGAPPAARRRTALLPDQAYHLGAAAVARRQRLLVLAGIFVLGSIVAVELGFRLAVAL